MALLVLFICAASVFADEPKFVIVTVRFEWADAVRSEEGEIEQVLDETEKVYFVPGPAGKYALPKSHARPISAGQAALILLQQREQLLAELNRNVTQSPQPRRLDKSSEWQQQQQDNQARQQQKLKEMQAEQFRMQREMEEQRQKQRIDDLNRQLGR